MARVLLNIDAGEYPDEPEELFSLAHLVSIACGGHAGDDASMDRAVGRCVRHRTMAGAHPSFPDRAGFGRTAMPIDAGTLRECVRAQVRSLVAVAGRRGVVVSYAKAHGALYHAANRDSELAEALVRGVVDGLGRPAPEVTLVGPTDGALVRSASRHGLAFAREGFADRGVRPDGSLVPRTEPGALVTVPAIAAARARELLMSGVVDTVCVHADTPGALLLARAVREVIDAEAR